MFIRKRPFSDERDQLLALSLQQNTDKTNRLSRPLIADWLTASSGNLRFSDGESLVSGRLGNLIPLELVIQGCTADAEMLGRLFFDPAALLQGFQQQIPFMFFDGR